MSTGLADTSHASSRSRGNGRSAVDGLPDELALSVITIAELRVGVLAAADAETRQRQPRPT